MKKLIYFLLLLPLLAFTSCNEKQSDYEAPVEAEEPVDLVARGEYLVETIGCSHCHSPKKMTDKGPVDDMDRYLSGHPSDSPLAPYDSAQVGPWILFYPDLTAAVGPWGTSFSGNITPDDTGIGSWTLEQFKKAVTQGKYKGMDNTRPMMPPMPLFSKMSDEDVEAIFTYLKSINPVENVPPAYIPPASTE